MECPPVLAVYSQDTVVLEGDSMKKALITGITGQDGAYLAEFLLGKGYEVHGIIRETSLANTERLNWQKISPARNFRLHPGDLTDGGNLQRIMQLAEPDEVYNLAAQSHVKVSFESPEPPGSG